MDEKQTAGFIEIPHTADWAVRVWSADLAGLLEQAARAMFVLTGVELADEPISRRAVDLSAPDAESLLVTFLSELLYLGETQGVGVKEMCLSVADGNHLEGWLECAPLLSQFKEIKAVTFHGLAIHQRADGLETTIVFDV